MPPVVNDKPYVPVLPYPGTLWAKVLGLYLPRYLSRRYGIVEVKCVHAERLAASIKAGHGVLITPNHCRDEDPLVLSSLARAVHQPFYVVASAHLFAGSKLQAFILRRAGAFSIYREGMDKQAVTTSIEILEKASRPLVIFPEGHISRTNDRITPMLEGTALIARQAAKKRGKETPAKKVVVHPVGIRYEFLFDIPRAAAKVLDEIEQRMTWRPSRELPIHERLHKVGAGLLALKELEYLGRTEAGTIAERLEKLIDAILEPLEKEYVHNDAAAMKHPVARVKRLRSEILPDLIKGDITDAERERRWRQLADATLAHQLYHYPPNYVDEAAAPGRVIETVERFEEDLTEKVRLHGPIRATITVGEAIEVSAGKDDNVMTSIDSSLRQILDIPQAAV